MTDIFKVAKETWEGAQVGLKPEQQAIVTGVENELKNLFKKGAFGAAGLGLEAAGVDTGELINKVQSGVNYVEDKRPDWLQNISQYVDVDPSIKPFNLGGSSVGLSATAPLGPVDVTAGSRAGGDGFTDPYLSGSMPLGAGNISGLLSRDSVGGQYTSENNIWNAGFRHNRISGDSSFRAGFKIPLGGK
jgi:hypothetical protein